MQNLYNEIYKKPADFLVKILTIYLSYYTTAYVKSLIPSTALHNLYITNK